MPLRVIVFTRYGNPDVLELRELEKPTPKDDDVLIRVRAAALNPLDWHIMRGLPYILRMQYGLIKPKSGRLGVDFAGTVEAVGKNVTQFRPGDDVFGARNGAFAEYVCTQGKALAAKPANLTFEQAAAVPVAGFTALQGLRDKGRVQPGQGVLINGASGGVGTFAVQLAKLFGAEVTGVCSTKNLEMVRSLGADHVIDYTQEDFTRSGQRYDLLVDCVGNHPLSTCRRVMSPTGTYVMVGGPLIRMLTVGVLSRVVRQSLVAFIASPNAADLIYMKELIEAEKLTPVIDRCYTLDEAPEAMRYLAEGHARGKVVLRMNGKGNDRPDSAG